MEEERETEIGPLSHMPKDFLICAIKFVIKIQLNFVVKYFERLRFL